MKLKIFTYTICIVIITILQSTVLNYIQIFNIKPNLIVVFIISCALARGNVDGAVIGLFCGLAQDISSGTVLGLYALLGFYLGFAVGSVNKRLYRDNLFVAVFITFCATFVYEFTFFFVTMFVNKRVDLWYALRRIIFPEAIYNSIVSVFIYIFVVRINMYLETFKKAARKY